MTKLSIGVSDCVSLFALSDESSPPLLDVRSPESSELERSPEYCDNTWDGDIL